MSNFILSACQGSRRARHELKSGIRSIREIRLALLHMRHHRLDLVRGADDLDLFIAFGLQDFGVARIGEHVAEPLGAADCVRVLRSEEHTSELQSLMRISYAVFCLKKKNTHKTHAHLI